MAPNRRIFVDGGIWKSKLENGLKLIQIINLGLCTKSESAKFNFLVLLSYIYFF